MENIKFVISDIYFGINYSIKIVKNEKFRNIFSKIILSWGFKKILITGSFTINILIQIHQIKKNIMVDNLFDEEIPKNSTKFDPN